MELARRVSPLIFARCYPTSAACSFDSLVARELKPIGILGGVFDPVHYGHLALATEAATRLDLAEVRFVPANVPPHRGQPHASAEQRVQMLKLAISGDRCFAVDQSEVLRQGPSYTVDTLNAMRGKLGGARPLCLLMGVDAFAGLASWHRWNDLFELAHIVVVQRPGYDLKNLQSPLKEELAKRKVKSWRAAFRKPSGAIILLKVKPVDISASMIREKLAAGKSTGDLLPPAVLDYIQKQGLYHGGG
ncbi:MAG TPA: nicotinate-nucleotide adenylyltransferase [Burkholderiales bacterium]|nr:nicotinate-nucleotide adenylyltransferase [Burkholderiales bacterium]